MHINVGACAVAALLLAPGPSFAQSSINYDTIHLDRRLTAVRASGPMMLDGALDEPAWSQAPVANGFIQNDPHEGTPATFDTEVRVLYTDDALYVGVFARDDDTSQIIVNDLKKDYDKEA